jgi:hypothetical protein
MDKKTSVSQKMIFTTNPIKTDRAKTTQKNVGL